MSQDLDKYLYFTVGLLKNSFALDALRQDALKYHMIDQPEKLIALRLTEYYEMIARESLPPGAGASLAPASSTVNNGETREGGATANAAGMGDTGSIASQNGADHIDDTHSTFLALSEMEKNAEEAADYWAAL